MLDTYFIGDIKRISPEAPVPVFRKKSEHSVLGGAANVAANLVAAGQNVSIMTIIGKDEAAQKLKDRFEEQGINTDLILPLDRHTTEKVRFLASNNQQVLRLDVEDTDDIGNIECEQLLNELAKKISRFDLRAFLLTVLHKASLEKQRRKAFLSLLTLRIKNMRSIREPDFLSQISRSLLI